MNRFATLLCLWLPFMSSVSTYTPCIFPCVVSAPPQELAKVTLSHYSGPTIDNCTTVPIGNAANLSREMDPTKLTVFIIHGFMNNGKSPMLQTIVEAYLPMDDHNIIVVDWGNIAGSLSYPYAALSVDGVAYYAATALKTFISLGFTLFHIIGHSLGAQMAGFIGSYMGGSLDRITGLDPAGPGFYFLIRDLQPTDARFVDEIHTDAGVFGTLVKGGRVNFYPNGGCSPQPGCLASGTLPDICSHSMAWELYAYSVRYPNSTVGVYCDSYADFIAGDCSSNEKILMGYGTPSSASGNVYLQTGCGPNYGLGDAGTTFQLSSLC